MERIIFTLVFIAGITSANAQFTITPVKAVAGTYKGNFSYPKVSSASARADAAWEKIATIIKCHPQLNITTLKIHFKNIFP